MIQETCDRRTLPVSRRHNHVDTEYCLAKMKRTGLDEGEDSVYIPCGWKYVTEPNPRFS